MSSLVEANDILLDNRNGFRKQRSTVDQIMSFTNIIETRKKNKLPTYCAFIDFQKAYDYINGRGCGRLVSVDECYQLSYTCTQMLLLVSESMACILTGLH